MKKSIFLITFVLISLNLCSQEAFTLLISDSTDQRPNDIVELSDHSFILTSGFFDTSVWYTKQRFYKIGNNGLVIHDTVITNPNGAGTFSTLHYFNDSSIFCLGDWQNYNKKIQLWVAGIDSEFNFNWNEKYQTIYDRGALGISIITSQNKVLSAGTFTNNPPYNDIMLVEFSTTGDSIRSMIDTTATGPILFDIMEFPGSGTYKGATFAYNNSSPGQILTFDSTLNIVEVDSIPNRVYNCLTIKKASGSKYYLSGNKIINGKADLAIMSLNQNNDCSGMAIVGKNDTIDYGGLSQSMDFLDPNIIYLGGTTNFCLGGTFCFQNSWYTLSRLDSSLNLQWTKYYGGDAYYRLINVVATQDGGAIMVGTRYDYLTQNNECDIYIVKVDENGVITGTETPDERKYHDAIVYPNPGSEHLIIESGEQISGALFRMFSMDGKEVLFHTLWDRKFRLDTKFLIPGTYIWEISDKGKRIESGKWVKK